MGNLLTGVVWKLLYSLNKVFNTGSKCKIFYHGKLMSSDHKQKTKFSIQGPEVIKAVDKTSSQAAISE